MPIILQEHAISSPKNGNLMFLSPRGEFFALLCRFDAVRWLVLYFFCWCATYLPRLRLETNSTKTLFSLLRYCALDDVNARNILRFRHVWRLHVHVQLSRDVSITQYIAHHFSIVVHRQFRTMQWQIDDGLKNDCRINVYGWNNCAKI